MGSEARARGREKERMGRREGVRVKGEKKEKGGRGREGEVIRLHKPSLGDEVLQLWALQPQQGWEVADDHLGPVHVHVHEVSVDTRTEQSTKVNRRE